MRKSLGTALLLLLIGTGASAASGAAEPERARGLPTKSPLAVFGRANTVTRLDPAKLTPTESGAELGEYHDTYSFSPDRSEVAFGISADSGTGAPRVGIRLVSARDLSITRNISTGVYGAGLAWLEPDRLVAVLGDSFVCQNPCGPQEDPDFSTVVAVNPVTGESLESRRLPHSCDTSEIRGRALLSLSERRLSIVGPEGQVKTVELPRAFAECGEIAGSSTAKEAFVLSEGGRDVARITLKTSRLTVHSLPVASDDAIGLGRERLVHTPKGGGIEIFDARTGRRRQLDPSAHAVRISGRRLFTLKSRGAGLSAYDLGGRRQFSVLRGERVTDVGVAGRFAYAIGRGSMAVVDLRSGRVLDRSRTRFRGDLLTEPSA